MTDSTTFYRAVINGVTQFLNNYEALVMQMDRIASDSTLSTQAAQAAQKGGRADLTTADFDNFKAAVTVLQTLMNSHNPDVNTDTVKLAFYNLL